VLPTSHKKIMVFKGVECNLQALNCILKELIVHAGNQNKTKIVECLRKIVPDYHPVDN
jgi:hypothetical protein